MDRNRQSINSEEQKLEQLEVVPEEPETSAVRLVNRAPWWLISIGLHVLFLLIVGWVWVWVWVILLAEEAMVV